MRGRINIERDNIYIQQGKDIRSIQIKSDVPEDMTLSIQVLYELEYETYTALAHVLVNKDFSLIPFSFGENHPNYHDVIKTLITDHKLMNFRGGKKSKDMSNCLLNDKLVSKKRLLTAFYDHVIANILLLDDSSKAHLFVIMKSLFSALKMKYPNAIYWQMDWKQLFIRELGKMVDRPLDVRILPKPQINIIVEEKIANPEQVNIFFDIWNQYRCHLESEDLKDFRVEKGNNFLSELINESIKNMNQDSDDYKFLNKALKILQLSSSQFNLYRNLQNYHDQLISKSPKNPRLQTINHFIDQLLAEKTALFYNSNNATFLISAESVLSVPNTILDDRLKRILNNASRVVRKENTHNILPLSWLNLDAAHAAVFVEVMNAKRLYGNEVELYQSLRIDITDQMKDFFANPEKIVDILELRDCLFRIITTFEIDFEMLQSNVSEFNEDNHNITILPKQLLRIEDKKLLGLILQLINYYNNPPSLNQVDRFPFSLFKSPQVITPDVSAAIKTMLPFLVTALIDETLEDFCSKNNEILQSIITDKMEPLASWFKQSKLISLDILKNEPEKPNV